MTHKADTLAFYDRAAADYAARFDTKGPDPDLTAFVDALPRGGRVLDFGCGPARAAAYFQNAGFAVEATDASQGMVDVADRRFGIKVRKAYFHELDAVDRYDGIWANFSLLHAPRADMAAHLARIKTALRPGGLLHLGLKTGSGEKTDELGRFYTFYAPDELDRLLTAAGLEIFRRREGCGVGMAGTNDPYIILLARA